MNIPQIYPVRKQAEIIYQVLEKRLETILPLAMREANLDMWLIICQEDDYDPVFKTLAPLDTWAPILQMIIFYDPGPGKSIERINLSMTDTRGLYERPWQGRHFEEQWALLREIIAARKPERIGLNISSVQWAAGGLTHNLYQQLAQALPDEYRARLASAEQAAARWLMTLSAEELGLYQQVARIAHWIIRECYSPRSITPGVTTTADLEWKYWQTAVDAGLELSFKPFFSIMRSQAGRQAHSPDDRVIRAGDLLHCDVGIRYLRLNSDHQELAYVLRPGEADIPAGLARLWEENRRLQQVFMAGFKPGLSGNQLLSRILSRARLAGIPNPKVYSHSLGLLLHEPGPLIGLPWQQEDIPGRGDVRLETNTCFTMELSVADYVEEWDSQLIRLPTEQDVMFTERGCQPIDGVQEAIYLV